MDGYGRRPLLLTSSAGLCVCLLGMGLLAPHPSLAPYMVAMMCLFMAFFSVAMGPICWVGTSEVFATSIRAKVRRSASTFKLLDNQLGGIRSEELLECGMRPMLL